MNAKQAAGEKAVELIQDGMKVGLGTGSTVFYTLKALGKRVREGLKIEAIPTSRATEQLAREEGIPLISFADITRLDLTIDGADEVNPQKQLIKGGGGALYREKLVASISDRLIIIVNTGKDKEVLGSFPLPVEIVPFGREVVTRRIERMGGNPVLRMDGVMPFATDNGNMILDCHFERIEDPASLHHQIKGMVGVVETGLFIDMADQIIVGYENGETKIWS
ncbi:MAG: ribose-5-phosphate isomerase RpiA [Bacteroidota bacterium]